MSTSTDPAPTEHGPVRTCVGCRGKASRDALVRIVLDPATASGALVDPGRSAPGRGAWLHPSRECLDLARRRRAVPRALRVAGPVDLAAVVAWFDRQDQRAVPDAQRGEDRVIDQEGGLEADGHPMSTQR